MQYVDAQATPTNQDVAGEIAELPEQSGGTIELVGVENDVTGDIRQQDLLERSVPGGPSTEQTDHTIEAGSKPKR
jgi:hypothetical protein